MGPKITIRLPDKLILRAKMQALRERRALQALTAEALEAYLRRVEKGGSAR